MVTQKKSPTPTSISGNKLKSFLKTYYKHIVLFLCLTLLNIFFLCWSFKTNNLAFSHTFILLLLGSILLEITLCGILFFAHRKSWPIEKIFLVLSLIIGSIYVLAIPVGRVPDEESHFFRIYEITDGNLVSTTTDDGRAAGSYEPSDIEIVRSFSKQNVTYHELLEYLDDSADDTRVFISTSAYGYNLFSYLPQITGMFIGKLFHLPFLVSAYFAKFFNLIACILILYYSIKYAPFFKRIIFFIAFLPITMQSMASLSADALITVSAIALVSFILYSIYTMRTTFTLKHYLILFTLCFFVCITKIVYAPLCLLLFAIPHTRFGTNRKKIFWVFGIGFAMIALYGIWYLVSPPTITVSDSSTQINTIIQNPFLYLSIILRSISTNATLYLSGTLGGFLEWFNIAPSMLYIIASYTIFILLCTASRYKNTITKAFKYLSIVAFIIIVLLTFTALYITWTKAGETLIDGVQGRYFLPILLLIPVFFLPTKQPTSSTLKKPSHTHQITKSPALNSHNYYLYGFFIFESIYVITTIACSHL